MGLESPDRRWEDINAPQEEANSTVIGKLDLNLAVSREEGIEGYGHENDAWSNKLKVDLNHQGQHDFLSMHVDVMCEGLESPCMESSLPQKTDQDQGEMSTRNIAYNQGMLPPSPTSTNKHYYEEKEVVSGSYSNRSSSPIEIEAFRVEMRNKESCKSPLEVDVHHQGGILEQENSDLWRGSSPLHKKKSSLLHDKKLEEKISRSLQCEKNESVCEEMEMGNNNHPMERSVCPEKMQNSPDETEQDVFHASRLSTDSRKLELHHLDLYSPQRTSERSVSPLRQMSISPNRSTHMELPLVQKPISPPQNIQDPLYSTRPSRQKCSPPLERSTADGKRISSQGHLSPARGNFASPWRQSSQDSQCRDGCSEKCPSRSSRGHHLPSDDRQPGRSQSQSPNRCRYSSAYRRDDCDRSRSRSSRTGDHQRRPPRMYSPRHRSPPSGCHSHHRSPRRRPWSPPPNRSTGVGKPGNNLFVAGFSFVTTERDLERKFSRFGRVRDVRIVRDKRSGDSRGFGFLSLERDEDADAAIRALDQTEWNGRIVMVEKSKTR